MQPIDRCGGWCCRTRRLLSFHNNRVRSTLTFKSIRIRELTIFRHLRKFPNLPELSIQKAQLAATCSTISCLTSSLDLIDPRIRDHHAQQIVLLRRHDLCLYASNYWASHLAKAFDAGESSGVCRDDWVSVHESIETFVAKHDEILSVRGLGHTKDCSAAFDHDWIAFSASASSFISKVLQYRSSPGKIARSSETIGKFLSDIGVHPNALSIVILTRRHTRFSPTARSCRLAHDPPD